MFQRPSSPTLRFLIGDQCGDGEDAVTQRGVVQRGGEDGGGGGGEEVHVREDIIHFLEEEIKVGEVGGGDI